VGLLARTLGLGLVCLGEAHAVDSYSGGLLTIPTLQAGTATYSNVVVQIGSIITAPSGTGPNGSVDTYSPIDNEITVQSVVVGQTTYYNAVASVKALVSIGGVSGADSYNAATGQITLSAVQYNDAIYTGVIITPGAILSTGGGMPANTMDVYDGQSGQLTLPAIQVGAKVYTNGILRPGRIVGAQGQLPVEKQFYQFSTVTAGGVADGAGPDAGLLAGSDGNFYGTTRYGGAHGQGAVIRLTPSGNESVLYAFGTAAKDGSDPSAGLIQDSAGNLYGTTIGGGAHGQGTVYRIDPAGKETILYSFGATVTDGSGPTCSLILDNSGNLYGTTPSGGANGSGTVFKVDPSGTETVLYSFLGAADGLAPFAGLTAGNDGNFYGTTTSGGGSYYGTVFRITPSGAFSSVYAFGTNGVTDAALPYASLTLGSDGNFYGTAYLGGLYGAGAVFRLTPAGAESVLYSFTGGGALAGSTDGASPYAGLIQGSDGNLYGTTATGGAYNVGSVFRITPATGRELLLYSFTGDPGGGAGISGSLDGAQPNGSLLEDGSHNFFGTASTGGAGLTGTVFKLTSVLTAH
jgi:uncharacterized repeat protein (TIGR03803 family)